MSGIGIDSSEWPVRDGSADGGVLATGERERDRGGSRRLCRIVWVDIGFYDHLACPEIYQCGQRAAGAAETEGGWTRKMRRGGNEIVRDSRGCSASQGSVSLGKTVVNVMRSIGKGNVRRERWERWASEWVHSQGGYSVSDGYLSVAASVWRVLKLIREASEQRGQRERWASEWVQSKGEARKSESESRTIQAVIAGRMGREQQERRERWAGGVQEQAGNSQIRK
ncbi:hypothetical protein BD410DRAFT_809412 [Rickenella mellea]|uniref:Uncharacterized protein n=1 Tax=Rickenella mellea TaxID=50990 RepID=A0A4Y7PJU4_9AGAM|nr:hypothetical protein BD410DRAFT_809412 [Rickenella mellea]